MSAVDRFEHVESFARCVQVNFGDLLANRFRICELFAGDLLESSIVRVDHFRWDAPHLHEFLIPRNHSSVFVRDQNGVCT